jgi:hypothetical protein
MDLNHLYSQHQLSVMRADASTSRVDRAEHLANAALFASRIGGYQFAKGAGAATEWLHGRMRPDKLAAQAGRQSL